MEVPKADPATVKPTTKSKSEDPVDIKKLGKNAKRKLQRKEAEKEIVKKEEELKKLR